MIRLDFGAAMLHSDTMPHRISIKELHQTTGDLVREAAESLEPIIVTDRGKEIAVLSNPLLLKPRERKRILLPGYEEMMRGPVVGSSIDDLNAIRGER